MQEQFDAENECYPERCSGTSSKEETAQDAHVGIYYIVGAGKY